MRTFLGLFSSGTVVAVLDGSGMKKGQYADRRTGNTRLAKVAACQPYREWRAPGEGWRGVWDEFRNWLAGS
jgi:hypothetical protein